MIRTITILLTVGALASAQVRIRATHQPLDTMAAVFAFKKVPPELKRLAFYHVMACPTAGSAVKISTDQIRYALSGGSLRLVSPVLGEVTIDARSRGARVWLDLGIDLAPGGSLAVAVSGADPWLRGAVFVGSIAARALGRSKPNPIRIVDPGHLDLEQGCASYTTLANWPAPEFVEATIE